MVMATSGTAALSTAEGENNARIRIFLANIATTVNNNAAVAASGDVISFSERSCQFCRGRSAVHQAS